MEREGRKEGRRQKERERTMTNVQEKTRRMVIGKSGQIFFLCLNIKHIEMAFEC